MRFGGGQEGNSEDTRKLAYEACDLCGVLRLIARNRHDDCSNTLGAQIDHQFVECFTMQRFVAPFTGCIDALTPLYVKSLQSTCYAASKIAAAD